MLKSSITYEIVKDKFGKNMFAYRGWSVQADHMPDDHGPQRCISFGETGIVLCFMNSRPKLHIPDGCKAELVMKGNFVEVRIF